MNLHTHTEFRKKPKDPSEIVSLTDSPKQKKEGARGLALHQASLDKLLTYLTINSIEDML